MLESTLIKSYYLVKYDNKANLLLYRKMQKRDDSRVKTWAKLVRQIIDKNIVPINFQKLLTLIGINIEVPTNVSYYDYEEDRITYIISYFFIGYVDKLLSEQNIFIENSIKLSFYDIHTGLQIHLIDKEIRDLFDTSKLCGVSVEVFTPADIVLEYQEEHP
jgi:hypothetical protein